MSLWTIRTRVMRVTTAVVIATKMVVMKVTARTILKIKEESTLNVLTTPYQRATYMKAPMAVVDLASLILHSYVVS